MTVADDLTKDFEDISVEQDRGILKKVLKKGTSEFKACHKDKVFVHYVGTYFGGEEDGKQFDSSRDRGETFSFTLGVGDVIRAWDVCVATMEYGEVCELIAAPKYAYDDGKAMKFNIELFYSEGEDVSEAKDGSSRKSVLDAGQSVSNPFYGVNASITYRELTSNDEVEVTYTVGDPEPFNVPKGIDEAVLTMSYKEKARVVCTESANHSGDSKATKHIYEVSLNSFDRIKRLASFDTFTDKLNYAQNIKKRANAHMGDQKYHLAVRVYKRLLDELQYVVADGQDEQRRVLETQGNTYNNLALAFIKMNKPEEAIEMCDKVLEMDPRNEKGLFRKGQAYLLLKDFEEAYDYFHKCSKEHPDNTAAKAEALKCDQKAQALRNAERAKFRGVFNKFRDTGLGVEEKEEPVEDKEDDQVSDSSEEN